MHVFVVHGLHTTMVQLVGKDALAETDKVVLESAR
jgi:hypothetical protein